ncbi:uncharacterized protein PHALS_08949 [Plasmopara halstedii]|uniref:Uncharacterized protein n=1 Tax=Plasmopara halstedii TaxID=4781 RepID=A0A0P1ADS8_PLAHL|nr:uncharacterized protein PHALS_08949 [Plasmopara halstedii]CEG38903.1 hypothetical protein PHALS_08949 [Plasmopara halstedii]|eukprot:XP_024575272.1 hypothetical protein PHALS_08949 [Plasmopara halstedii]
MKLSCMMDIDRNFSFGAFCAPSAILPSCNLLHIYRRDITQFLKEVISGNTNTVILCTPITSLSVAVSAVPSKPDMDESIYTLGNQLNYLHL